MFRTFQESKIWLLMPYRDVKVHGETTLWHFVRVRFLMKLMYITVYYGVIDMHTVV